VQGVRNVKKSPLICKYVFIAPPSMDSLEERLRLRGTETEEKIRIRLHNATEELAYGSETGNFDAVIVNNDLAVAYAELVSVLRLWYPELI
jgi:guanylate kinase